MAKKLTQEEFLVRAKEVHGDRYDYSLVDYKTSKEKVKILCKEHGVFEQRPKAHFKGDGCKKCASIESSKNQRYSTGEFIEKAKLIHGDKYNYDLVDYKRFKDKVKILCPEHGVFEKRSTNHLHGEGCQKCAIIKSAKKLAYSIEAFIEKAKLIHGDKYNYDLVDYVDIKTKIKILCPKHNEFEQIPKII